jgi:hypothetical protein
VSVSVHNIYLFKYVSPSPTLGIQPCCACPFKLPKLVVLYICVVTCLAIGWRYKFRVRRSLYRKWLDIHSAERFHSTLQIFNTRTFSRSFLVDVLFPGTIFSTYIHWRPAGLVVWGPAYETRGPGFKSWWWVGIIVMKNYTCSRVMAIS